MLTTWVMVWRTFTKLVHSERGVSALWFWRNETRDAVQESSRGFLSRAECEADALRSGCKPEEHSQERRIAVSRLFAPIRVSV